MAQRPTSAFLFSLVGGFVTLLVALVSINSWYFMYSFSGMSFRYSILGSMLNVDAGSALALFLVGAACGASIVTGAFLQRTGRKPLVRAGSLVVLGASIIGAPATFFGMIIGGVLSVAGGVKGLTWRPTGAPPPVANDRQNW